VSNFHFHNVDTQNFRQQQKKIVTEVVAWSKDVIGNVKKPVVIGGPSGAGKEN